MKIEIIAVGNEVLCGDVVNTNAAWLSARLFELGLEVKRHSTIADDESQITQSLIQASEEMDVVLVTGGLGPTVDDFTLEVAAKSFGVRLVENSLVTEQLYQFYSARGREMTPNQKKQAFLPEGAEVFLNPVGSAPGVRVQFKNTQFFFMPGVPKEMKEIAKQFIFPFLTKNNTSHSSFYSRTLRCFGAEEAKLDHLLKPLIKDRVDIGTAKIAFRVSLPDILIKVSAWAANAEEAKTRVTESIKLVEAKVGDFVYGEGEDTLEQCVGKLLSENKKTIAVAESCTGGHLANRITNVPGSSQYFLGGVLAYNNQVKRNLLKVTETSLNKFGAVSEECAAEMVQGLYELTKADYCISITGIAGPEGGSPDKPVGTVFVALYAQGKLEVKKFLYPTNREWFKQIVSSVALNWVRKKLITT